MRPPEYSISCFRVMAFGALLMVSPPLSADDSLPLEIVVEGKGPVALLSQSDLDSLTQQSIETVSPYFNGQIRFSGPELEAVLQHAAVSNVSDSRPITLRALNHYSVKTTTGALIETGAIVATRKSGSRLSLRDRGPFWIILPLSDRPELDNENYHRLLVWQLSHIEIGM